MQTKWMCSEAIKYFAQSLPAPESLNFNTYFILNLIMVPWSRFCLLLTLSQCLMHKHFFFVLTSLSLKLIWKNLFAGSESFSRYRVTCIHSPDKCKYSELCSNQQTVWTLYILSRLWNRSEKFCLLEKWFPILLLKDVHLVVILENGRLIAARSFNTELHG